MSRKIDWAELIGELVDEHYPDKRRSLVMDNLNTHKLPSLYEAFEPAEARRIAERLEIHYTPKHGSWLNMAEIEIGGKLPLQVSAGFLRRVSTSRDRPVSPLAQVNDQRRLASRIVCGGKEYVGVEKQLHFDGVTASSMRLRSRSSSLSSASHCAI